MKLFEVKNETPKWLLAESTKNTHLEHLEDLIFNNGYAGAQRALDYVESLRSMLADGVGNTTKLTVKWDGSPAIVCGTDPADGKFFVGTKSVFNKVTPKLCKSIKDIEELYSEQPGLAEKLVSSLKHLRKLGISGVLQGDLMFTEGDVSVVNVDNEDCYVFTPNTITYAVPVNSELGKRIARAKIGIIFHTSYSGESIDTMTAEFGVNLGTLTLSRDVWFDDATYKDYTGVASLTPEENTALIKYIASTTVTMEKIGQDKFDIVIADRDFAKIIKPFINKSIRGGVQVGEPTEFLKKFVLYYSSEIMKGVENLASGPAGRAAQNRLAKIKAREEWIADNSNTLLGILAVYKKVIELKGLIMVKLNQVDKIGTFQKTENGYKVTTPEGFVAIGHNGGAVKLVDRLEFSRTNAARHGR